MTASTSASSLPGGGPAALITLRTYPPLPSFSIPFRVPDPAADISSFKLSILRILTGQTNYESSSKPLTFSEEVKEKAINGWKMQMLTLELRQKDDLQSESYFDAETTQVPAGDNGVQEAKDQEMEGFELQDHHECSLIEEGDEIVVRLRPGHSLKDLELPKLPSNHRYSAPAGSLTRAGTLSEPPPYSIIQPSEPSSFSSSVGAQPHANYHQHRYQDYRQTFRVVTADNVGSGRIRRTTANTSGSGYGNGPAALGQGLNLVQSSSRPNGAKPKKRPSASGTSNTRALSSPKISSSTPTNVTSSSVNPSTTTLAPSSIDQQNVASPPSTPNLGTVSVSTTASPPKTSRKNSSSTVTIQQQQNTNNSQRQAASSSPNPNGRSSGQFGAMPATALVIGPGVQGQVGRNPASASAPVGSMGGPEIEEYGNAKGFVSFTSASATDIRGKPRRKASKDQILSNDTVLDSNNGHKRRPSNPASAAADAAERRAAIARQARQEEAEPTVGTSKRPSRDRQGSSGSRIGRADLPSPPLLPPIQNLAPFPEFAAASTERRERDLPPMPSAATDAVPSSSMVAVSSSTDARPPRLSFLRKFSSATQTSNNTSDSQALAGVDQQMQGLGLQQTAIATSSPLEEYDPAIQPAGGEASKDSSLTRAERRYMEVQKALALEREKQAEAERVRTDKMKSSQERKQKEREQKEAEAKKRVEEQKWEIWEEVRRRQKAEPSGSAVPPAIQRLYSEDSATSSTPKQQASTSKPKLPPSPELTKATLAAPTAPTPSQVTASASAGALASNGASGSSRPPVGAAGGNSFNSSASGPRIELGLDRIIKLLRRLNSPHKAFPVIHVAGTNGKGSTIAYLDAVLRNALDIRTGTFVSPHLVERRDCCRVDGQIIDKDVWRRAQSDVLFADQGFEVAPSKDDDGQPLKSSPFELLTAQTFQAFFLLPEEQRPEILLIEVGLGGRLDATNVFEDSQVLASLICPIDRDHEAFLGSQLEGIAREKAGIVKDTGLCIIADQRLGDASPVDQLALGPLENETKQIGPRAAGILDSIRNVCMSKRARLVKTYIPWKLLSLPPTKQDRWGSSIDFTPRLAPTLFLSTSGLNPPSTFVAHPHDPVMFSVPVSVEKTRANLTGVCMALQALSSIARDEWAQDRWEDLRTRIMWGLRDDAEANLRVREAIGSVKWEGRCSWHKMDGMDVLVDGAHNESSAVALREYLDNCLATRSLSSISTGSGSGKGKTKSSSGVDGNGSKFDVNFVLAFSDGKDYGSMVQALLSNPSDLIGKQNVALTTFSPPEGMPWVQSTPVQEALDTIKQLLPKNHVEDENQGNVRIDDLTTKSDVRDAMDWAKQSQRNAANKDDKRQSITVVAGSLYLVADMYRLLRDHGDWRA